MKESREVLEIINNRLGNYFGKYEDGRPYWRVVWSHDEFEKRSGTFRDHTPEGLFIREVKEVRELPKYRHYMNPPRYVLEGLKEIPLGAQTDLITNISYEPAWSFINFDTGEVLPLKWEAIEYVIHIIYENLAAQHGIKYQDPRYNPEQYLENKQNEFKRLYNSLWGNETEVTDALTYKEGIVVPSNFNKSEEVIH